MDFAYSYAGFVHRWRFALLGLVLAVTGLALMQVRALRVDSRLEALLDDDSPNKHAVDKLRQRAKLNSPLHVLVASSDTQLNRQLSAQLQERIAAWPEVRWAIDRRDSRFFRDRQLLYLPPQEIDALYDLLTRRVEWEQCQANPFCVSLEDESELPDEKALRAKLRRSPAVASLLRVAGEPVDQSAGVPAGESPSKPANKPANKPTTDDSTARSGSTTQATPHQPPPAAVRTEAKQQGPSTGLLCRPDGEVCAVEAVLRGSPSNLRYATRIYTKAQRLIDSLRPQNAPDDLRIVLSGAYRNAPLTQRSVLRDLQRISILSLALLAVVLVVQFRGWRAALLLFAPLLVGVTWALAVAALIHPTLNLISAFVFAVLTGLGIDFGIHLVTHYSANRCRGESVAEAIASTFHDLGTALGVAALTTASGFAALAAANFRGFAEMGLLVSIGVIVSVAAFCLVLPVLAALIDEGPVRPMLRRWPSVFGMMRSKRRAGQVMFAGTFVGIALAVAATQVRYERDFSNLRPRGVAHGIERASEAFHGTGVRATYMLADNHQALEAAAAQVRAQPLSYGNTIEAPLVLTTETFVPREQTRRLAAIARLRALWQRHRDRIDDPEKQAEWDRLVAPTEPIGWSDLPAWIRGSFEEQDGRRGRLGVIYTRHKGSSVTDMERLSQQIERWSQHHPRVTFASPEALLGEVMPALRRDLPRSLGLAFLGLCLGTLLLGRSWKRSVLVLLPTMGAIGSVVGLMAMFSMRLNIYNVLFFPIALGIGVDGAVYLVWTASHGRASGRAEAFRTSMRAVLVSTLTTALAFGSMITASNPGLASLGWVAVFTVCAVLGANMAWLPALLRYSMRIRTSIVPPYHPSAHDLPRQRLSLDGQSQRPTAARVSVHLEATAAEPTKPTAVLQPAAERPTDDRSVSRHR